MTNTKLITKIVEEKQTSIEQALELFDQLETIDLEFIFGQWRGYGLHTNHRMDGLLETFNWYGKEFIDADQVHPLLFLNRQNQPIKIAPNPFFIDLAVKLNFPKPNFLTTFFRLSIPWFKTEQSRARLRMMEYRGAVSATMIYDYLPIHDHFRKIDETTVLGLMDFKPLSQPFFFLLKRD